MDAKQRNLHCDIGAENNSTWALKTKARVSRFDFRTCVYFCVYKVERTVEPLLYDHPQNHIDVVV